MICKEGAVISGRYRLTSLIGEGGMASVWRAEDDTLKRPVAIKLLYVRSHRESQSAIDQFLREARLAASVQHRNVIHTVDFGVTDEHMPFMVMELLSGESLADRLLRSPPLRMEEVVHVASLTLRGLSAVHDAGIVHRDLKPQNIFLQRDADAVFPKILDFGISRSLGSGSESAIATQQGMILGTPEYMAPEQARGLSDIDKRADIYAMGAIIYEGITGHVPFEAEQLAELIVKIATQTAPAMRALRADVPPLLSDCIAQALAPDRESRFADAAAFRKALTRAAERSFGSTKQAIISESPVEHLPLDAPANEQREEAPQLAAAAGGVWGGFSELEARSSRGSAAGRAPSPAVASAAVAKERVSAAVGPVVSKAPAGGGRPSTAQPSRTSNPHPAARGSANQVPQGDGLQVPHDDSLFGDNPLDTFAGSDTGRLELDISGPQFQRVAGIAQMPSTRVSRAESLKAPAESRARRPSSTPSAAFWVFPVLLLVGFALLFLAPSLFSPAPADESASVKREEDNPATRNGKPYREIGPRPRVGAVAPAVRDVTF
ncbi:MAG TPA: serine/threonine-protein kinase [Polyangiales bacterium]|nr:serine/threonine-protein kinase [Polyangiales bacterium]